MNRDLHSTPHDRTQTLLMQSIYSFYQGTQRHLETVLAKHHEITFSQFLILISVTYRKEGCVMSQVTLADFLNITEATVSRHIKTLVALGFLTKEKASTNKKSFDLALTSHGEKVVKKAEKRIMQEIDSFLNHVTNKDSKIIINNLTTSLTMLQQRK